MEERLPRKPTKKPPIQAKKNSAAPALVDIEADEGSDDDEEDEDEEDIPISDLEDLDDEDKEDLIPHTRLTINNTTALLAALNRIALPTDNTKAAPFSTHQSVISSTETAEAIPDVSDDLQRELAFYSQSLEAVKKARKLLKVEGVPFSRPKDYFAEMVKEDAHMERVKAKLVDEASNKKAAAEARKQRDLKKFGKQVQVAKLQERQKAKRETLEKIKTLKRSKFPNDPVWVFHQAQHFANNGPSTERQESGGDNNTKEADMFDVSIEQELGKSSGNKNGRGGRDGRSGSGRGSIGSGRGGSSFNKRQKKDEKFGFGGKKRHGKSGDAMSSSDLSGFDAKGMKAGGGRGGRGGARGGSRGGRVSKSTRPGKDRRKAMGGR